MKKLAILLLSAVLLLSACEELTVDGFVDEPASVEIADNPDKDGGVQEPVTPVEPVEPEPPEPPEPEFIRITAVAAGDNLIHSPIYAQADRRAEGVGEYDFAPAYENIADLISRHDLAMINQETLICNDLYPPSNYPYFNSPNALGEHMIDIGFDVFSIANNHTLDQGVEGLSACLDYWEERGALYNAVVVGAYRDLEDRANIRTKEIDGVVFSFLSYTEHLNGLVLPSNSVLEIGDSKELERVAAEIKSAKEISDVCVVFLHWGAENGDQIEAYQQVAAQVMSDAGADIILGTHPHVLRDIEWVEATDGRRTLTAYSLANFISCQNIPQTMIGGVLSFDVVVNAATREVRIEGAVLIPIVTHFERQYSAVRIYPLEDYTEDLANAHGVREFGTFGYDYIFDVIRRTVSEKWLPDWLHA